MPINHEVCLPFKDVWAAPGSQMYEALKEKDFEKAKRIYEQCEVDNRRLTQKGKEHVES